jgi:hypothetical protein
MRKGRGGGRGGGGRRRREEEGEAEEVEEAEEKEKEEEKKEKAERKEKAEEDGGERERMMDGGDEGPSPRALMLTRTRHILIRAPPTTRAGIAAATTRPNSSIA